MNIEYICSDCGKTKNDDDSRYSLTQEGEKTCWECHQIDQLRKSQTKILRNILKELRQFKKLQIEINEIIEKNR